VALAAISAFCLAAFSAQAQEKIVELGTLKVNQPPDVGATAEVTTDELDGVPVLKLVFPEGEYEAWRSSAKLEIAPPAAGEYTMTFQAKADPGDFHIEVRVWDFASTQTRQVVPPKSFKMDQEWKEYVYDFSIENSETGPVTVTWGGLARPGKTLFFRDVKLTKN
jgi:hypothetical protein